MDGVQRQDGALPHRSFSTDQQSILRLASDILDVPLNQLISLKSSNTLPKSSPSNAFVVPYLTVSRPEHLNNFSSAPKSFPPVAGGSKLPRDLQTTSNQFPITAPGLFGLRDHGWTYRSNHSALEEIPSAESYNSQSDVTGIRPLTSSDNSTSLDIIFTPEGGSSPPDTEHNQSVITTSKPITGTRSDQRLGADRRDPWAPAGMGDISQNGRDQGLRRAGGTSLAEFTQEQAGVNWMPATDSNNLEGLQPNTWSHWSLLEAPSSVGFSDGDLSPWSNLDQVIGSQNGDIFNEEELSFPLGYVNTDDGLQNPIMGPVPPRNIRKNQRSSNMNPIAPSQFDYEPCTDTANFSNSSNNDLFLQLMNEHYGHSRDNGAASPFNTIEVADQDGAKHNSKSEQPFASPHPFMSQSGSHNKLLRDRNTQEPNELRQDHSFRTAILGSQRVHKAIVKRPKTRGPFSAQERRQTARTRNLTACLRCHTQRLRCVTNDGDPSGTCQTCARITGPVMTRMPCLRYKRSDLKFAVQKQSPEQYWSTRWSAMKLQEIETWADSNTHFIVLTQDVGSARDFLRVRRIIPQHGDSLQRTWLSKSSGQRQFHECAPYAIENIHEAANEMRASFLKDIPEYITHYTDEKDVLLRSTYETAFKHSKIAQTDKERTLLSNVLLLWVTARYDSKPSRICSDDTLDMEPQHIDHERHDYGQVPIPPVINAQLSLVCGAALIDPLHRDIRRDLAWFFENKKRRTESWFTLYLSIFVLLHNYTLITKYYEKKARNLRLHTRYAAMAVLERLHTSANILLAYFHYCTPGGLPFVKGWTSDDDISRCHVNGEQVRFLQQTSEEIKNKASLMKEIRAGSQFEHDLYFLGQLFDLEWKPSPRTING